jgi:2-C-methyl-D-erythritol 4-phosphate cytidylyltransferase
MYLSAMQSVPNSEFFTDDCGLIEAYGKLVKIVDGDNTNIKITTPEDLIIAEAIINKGEKDEL